MDLGIAGRKAIVCASSRGIGRGCAFRLAEAGCEVIVNGRNEETTRATAGEIAAATGAKVTPVIADVSTADGQTKLLDACRDPDILVNNNAGPPFRDFRELSRDDILNHIRGHEADLYTRAVDIVVSRLRKKLEPLDAIKTLRNAGYTLALQRRAP